MRKWKKSSLTSSLHYYSFIIKWAPDWSYIVQVIHRRWKFEIMLWVLLAYTGCKLGSSLKIIWSVTQNPACYRKLLCCAHWTDSKYIQTTWCLCSESSWNHQKIGGICWEISLSSKRATVPNALEPFSDCGLENCSRIDHNFSNNPF